MAEARYYYLQLKDDIFSSRRIKKMKKMDRGDTLFVIYLKLQIIAMKHDGYLTFTGLESTFAEELALDIDETTEDVEACLDFLLKTELAEEHEEGKIFLPWAVKNSRSEGASAGRMRDKRAKEKAEKSQTKEDSEQSDGASEQSAESVTDNYNYNDNHNTESDIGYKKREYEEDNVFDQIWDLYHRKTGDVRTAYSEYLHALDTGATEEKILNGLKSQLLELKTQETRYIPSRQNWLRNKAWKTRNTASPKSESRPTALDCDDLPPDE